MPVSELHGQVAAIALPAGLTWAAYDVSMSEAQREREPHGHEPAVDQAAATIEDLARAQHAQPVSDPGELADDIWESDEELEAFLADLRAARNASLA